MDFDTLDKQMRGFEQSLDRTMLEGIYIVARLDGHGFTRLTKKDMNLEKPFDVRFLDMTRLGLPQKMERHGPSPTSTTTIMVGISSNAVARMLKV